MKLYFSTIRVALPNTEVLTYWESGHPDEYDVQELFARSARYHTVAELLTETAEVAVSHYIYETESPGPDAVAEQSHFDLLDAYNELARRHRRARFEHREDVCKVRTFSLHLELLRRDRMDHRRTISPAYYEKMAEAKAVFCSYCTLGAMLFWEDCEGCKIQRMFHAVQRTIKEEMPPKEQGAIVQEQNTYEGIDLPREMIESIGKGPATEGGFRTSPEFIIWEKTGLPDFAGTDDLPPTQSTLYYLRVICVERGQRTIMEAIQIWDTSYANVRKEIKSVVDRRLQQSVDSLWGIEALPFLKQYLLYPYAPEDLAEDLLKELANQSEAGGDTAGFVSTQEHFLAAPRNMRGLQDSSLIQNAHVSLSRQAGSGHPRHFLKVRNTIPPRFTSLLEIREANAAAIQKELERLLGYLAEVERLRNPLAPSGGAAATGEGQGNAH